MQFSQFMNEATQSHKVQRISFDILRIVGKAKNMTTTLKNSRGHYHLQDSAKKASYN